MRSVLSARVVNPGNMAPDNTTRQATTRLAQCLIIMRSTTFFVKPVLVFYLYTGILFVLFPNFLGFHPLQDAATQLLAGGPFRGCYGHP